MSSTVVGKMFFSSARRFLIYDAPESADPQFYRCPATMGGAAAGPFYRAVRAPVHDPERRHGRTLDSQGENPARMGLLRHEWSAEVPPRVRPNEVPSGGPGTALPSASRHLFSPVAVRCAAGSAPDFIQTQEYVIQINGGRIQTNETAGRCAVSLRERNGLVCRSVFIRARPPGHLSQQREEVRPDSAQARPRTRGQVIE